MFVGVAVTVPETVTVIFECGRGYGRLTEAGMAIYVRRSTFRHVAPRGLEAVVKALAGNFGKR
jgi:hypothetical protein